MSDNLKKWQDDTNTRISEHFKSMASNPTIETQLRARIEQLEAALRDAIESIEEWGAYASVYFQKKHALAGDIDRARRALGEQKDEKKRKMED